MGSVCGFPAKRSAYYATGRRKPLEVRPGVAGSHPGAGFLGWWGGGGGGALAGDGHVEFWDGSPLLLTESVSSRDWKEETFPRGPGGFL